MVRSRLLGRIPLIIGLSGMLTAVLLNARVFASSESTPAGTPPAPAPITQATMRGIFSAFASVYSYSLNMDYFSDRRNRESITSALLALVTNTSALEEHGGGLDPSFGYLRSALAGDAKQALDRYNKREFLGSQFMLNKLMENCATCHSRAPYNTPFESGAEFLKTARVEALAPLDRIQIELAARQFNQALATYEEVLSSPKIPEEGLQLIGAFEGYLKVCLGVENDVERPIATFGQLARREDASDQLKNLVAGWIRDLRSLDWPAPPGHEMAYARSLVGDQTVLAGPAAEGPELVRMIAANVILRRYLSSLSSYGDETAEIYYLLAVTESHISRSYWIAETDFLLERSVRSAPKTEYARKSLAILVERAKNPRPPAAYEGQEMPVVDVGELRKLVEG